MSDLSKYKIISTLGKGCFSKVKKAIHIETNEYVAIKIIKKCEDKNPMSAITKEIQIHRQLCHENIINLYCTFEDDEYVYLVQEYVENGTLNDLTTKTNISQNFALKIFYELVKALVYLHSKGISHRDLKPHNILFGTNYIVKLADFGLSNFYKNKLKTPCGSAYYVAPDIIIGEPYNPEYSDTWSTGIILYRMIVGDLPFNSKINCKQDLFQNILKGKYFIPKYLNTDVKDLIKKLLQVDKYQRIRLNDIIYHPCLRKYYNNDKNINGCLYKNIFDKVKRKLGGLGISFTTDFLENIYSVSSFNKDIDKTVIFKLYYNKYCNNFYYTNNLNYEFLIENNIIKPKNSNSVDVRKRKNTLNTQKITKIENNNDNIKKNKFKFLKNKPNINKQIFKNNTQINNNNKSKLININKITNILKNYTINNNKISNSKLSNVTNITNKNDIMYNLFKNKLSTHSLKKQQKKNKSNSINLHTKNISFSKDINKMPLSKVKNKSINLKKDISIVSKCLSKFDKKQKLSFFKKKKKISNCNFTIIDTKNNEINLNKNKIKYNLLKKNKNISKY